LPEFSKLFLQKNQPQGKEEWVMVSCTCYKSTVSLFLTLDCYHNILIEAGDFYNIITGAHNILVKTGHFHNIITGAASQSAPAFRLVFLRRNKPQTCISHVLLAANHLACTEKQAFPNFESHSTLTKLRMNALNMYSRERERERERERTDKEVNNRE